MLKIALAAVAIVLCAAATTAVALKPAVDAYAVYNKAADKFDFVASNTTAPATWACRIQANFTVNVTGWNEITVSASPALLKTDPATAYRACAAAEGYYFYEEAVAAMANAQFTTGSFADMKPAVAAAGAALTKEQISHNFFLELWTNLQAYERTTITGQSTMRFVAWIKGAAEGVNAGLDAAKSTAPRMSPLLALMYSIQAETPDYVTAAMYLAKQPTPASPPMTRPNNTLPPSPIIKSSSNAGNLMTASEAVDAANSKLMQQARAAGVAGVQQGGDESQDEDPAWLKQAKSRRGSHCSALLRLAESDLMFSHVTWSGFDSFGDRVLRTLNVENSIYYSTYVLSISSIDDFYIGNRLTVLETTLVQENVDLIHKYVNTRNPPTAFNVMAANLWAETPEMWKNIFVGANSGTYANSWLVVSRSITMDNIKTKKLPAGSVWMIEALPGPNSVTGDITADLVKNGYIMGDNIAYFDKTYKITLEEQQCLQQGSIFCKTNYSRAQIFARNATSINTIDQFKRMMRYNDFQKDPLSLIPNCPSCNPRYNPQLAIANRADLVPENANFAELYNPAWVNNAAFLSRGAFGAIDAKMIAWSQIDASSGAFVPHAISGPTTDQQPPFSWKAYRPEGPYPSGAQLGPMDNKWYTPAAPVVLSRSEKAPWPVAAPESLAHKLEGGAIAGIVIGSIAFVIILGFLFWRKRATSHGDGYKEQEANSMVNNGASKGYASV